MPSQSSDADLIPRLENVFFTSEASKKIFLLPLREKMSSVISPSGDREIKFTAEGTYLNDKTAMRSRSTVDR